MISRRRLGMGMKGFGERYDELLCCRCGLAQGLWPMLDWAIFPLRYRLPKDWTNNALRNDLNTTTTSTGGGKDDTKGKRA